MKRKWPLIFLQPGDALDLLAPAIVKSGAGMIVGSIFAVAAYDAAQGDPVTGHVVGVWRLPKAGTPLDVRRRREGLLG